MKGTKSSDVAIVGVSCRLPGADDYESYWHNLVKKEHSIKEIPLDRWDVGLHYSPHKNQANKSISKWCGLIDDIKNFDNEFFNISPIEARNMDPQQRLLLQESWHCIEDSAIPLKTLQTNKTSVFVGAMNSDYLRTLSKSEDLPNRFSILGNDHCILANRVSHQFNLSGESISVNAASASSLVAIHKAKSAIVAGECDYAIAAGVNLNTDPFKYIVFSQAGMLSPDGQCKSFSDNANGYVPGDGVGVLLLQPLTKAIENNHHIYGVIKGSAINHIGSGQTITAPCAKAQAKVIKEALINAEKNVSDVGYIEAHGSGTPLGDPIELAAINDVFKNTSSEVIIGSVKPNIGHLEAAAGIAGVIKALHVLKKQYIPANLNFNKINPVINLKQSKLKMASGEYLNTHKTPCIGVSSFGLGGVSCHLILEKYQQPENHQQTHLPQKRASHFVLSAKTKLSLEHGIRNWQQYLQSSKSSLENIHDLCASITSGREQFLHRVGCLVSNKDQLIKELNHLSVNSQQTFTNTSIVFGDNRESKLLRNIQLVNNHYRSLFSLAESSTQYNAQKALNVFRKTDFKGTLLSVAVFNSLQEMNAMPSLVEQVGQNTWATLLAVESVTLDDYLAVVLHNKTLGEVAFYHPKYPLKISPESQIIFPQYINKNLLKQFFNEVDSQYANYQHIIDQSMALLNSDKRFKELISAWNFTGENQGDLIEILRDFPTYLANDIQIAAYTLVAAKVTLNRFYQKWQIDCDFKHELYHTTLICDLIEHKVFSLSLFLKISQKQTAANQDIFKDINRKHWRIINKLVNDKKKHLHKKEITDKLLLLAAIEQKTVKLSTISKNITRFAIGQLPADSADCIDLQIYNIQKWQQVLLSYWLKGHDVNWDILYPSNSFQTTSLPTYSFEKNKFWAAVKTTKTKDILIDEPNTEASLTASAKTEKFETQLNNQVNKQSKQLAEVVIDVLASQLSLESINIDLNKNIAAFGLDSMAYTSISEKINEALSTQLTPACFYGFQNIQQLIDTVIKQHDNNVTTVHGMADESTSATSSSQVSESNHLNFNTISSHPQQDQANTRANSATESTEDIAIIGYSGQLPQADSLEHFWSNLMNGVDGITVIPDDRWKWQDYYSSDIKQANKSNSKWGGFIKDIDCFDAAFFGISPQEAKLMDPQQRLLLQNVWHALEHAGQQPEALSGSDTGVFIGASTSDYEELIRNNELAAHASTGMNRSIIANRISFVLDLLGPSEVVDTACSSSLVAIHKAVRAIQSGTCHMALAGGVNALITPTHYISYGKAGMLSPDGSCKTFDQSANGYVRAEGVGVLLLKSLSQAIKNKDNIHALIKASGINHGGKASSLTAPNPKAQAKLIFDTYQKSDIKCNSIDYIENHGTGTPLGDPIEINGLNLAFEQLSAKEKNEHCDHLCHLASVKSNIGHLEAAAGVAGVLKVLLALKHEYLPASQHIKNMNPMVKPDKHRFKILQQNIPWKSQPQHKMRRAGISSFGFGGVNAHMVIEEYSQLNSNDTSVSNSQAKNIVLISARTRQSLDKYAQKYIQHFSDSDETVTIEQIAFTSQTGRNHENHRLAIITNSIQQLIQALTDFINGKKSASFCTAEIELKQNSQTDSGEMKNLWKQDAHEKLAALWANGKNINWNSFYLNQTIQKVVLPQYPFTKKSHWLHSKSESVLTPQINSNVTKEIEYTLNYNISKQHYLATEHVVNNEAILPGVFSLSLFYETLAKAKASVNIYSVVFKDVMWNKPIVCQKNFTALQVANLKNSNDNQFKITIVDTKTSKKSVLTQAAYLDNQAETAPTNPIDFQIFKTVQFNDFYDQLFAIGFSYGRNFQVVQQIKYHHLHYLSQLVVGNDAVDKNTFLLDPRLMDGALQTCLIALIDSGTINHSNNQSYIPMMIEQFQVYKTIPSTVFALVHLLPSQPSQQQIRTFDILLLNKHNQVCVSIKNVVFKQFNKPHSANKNNNSHTQFKHINHPVDSKVHSDIQHMSSETEVNFSKGKSAVNNQALRQKTSNYFIQKIAKIAELDSNEININQSFKEYGIDSFLTLSVIRNLEEDFGDLRKTLMFEASNISELVDVFISEQQDKLIELFGENQHVLNSGDANDIKQSNTETKVEAQNNVDISQIFTAEKSTNHLNKESSEKLKNHKILEDESLSESPELTEVVEQLFKRYGQESVALSRKDIAPFIYLCSQHTGLFYFNVHKNILLAFRYVGPKDFFHDAINELKQYCQNNVLEMNVLSDIHLAEIQNRGLSANTFGVVQRLPNVLNLSLDGGKMRRLRYQVNKFKQSGQAELIEYSAGSDTSKDDAVARMIEKWAQMKRAVNPYIWRVKEDMQTGCLGSDYRIFLTYLDNSLQNVIIISKIESDNSYLLDTEFYSSEMAVGAMEYGIYQIIDTLRQEGIDAFSLGLTFGASFKESSQADPAVSEVLNNLAADGIFEEAGNFQFKNKFRCQNAALYLYRTAGQSSSNILDIIMMIGNPLSAKPSKQVITNGGETTDFDMPHYNSTITDHQNNGVINPADQSITEQTANVSPVNFDRNDAIQTAGYNPFNLERIQIEFDLATDSWSELEYSFIQNRTRFLQNKTQNNDISLESAITSVFGLPHVLPFAAGRVAESFFCSAWPKDKKYVIQNVLFPTCLFHQFDNDFIPLEVVDESFYDRQSNHIFKGNMDIDALKIQIHEHSDDIAFVWIELANNATGGCSVSIQNLKQIKSNIGEIPLVIDATRIIENAYHIRTYEPGYKEVDIWDIVQEICAYADVINASLTKDFGTHCGGLIATRDEELYARILDSVTTNGSGISRTDRQLITHALLDKSFITESVKQRMDAVLQLGNHLNNHGLTVVQPIGGHCILIDPMSINELSQLTTPLPAFLAWLYQNTGIRAGIHSVGRQRNSTMNNLIRLAVPVGLKQSQIKIIGDRLVKAFSNKSIMNDLVLKNKPDGLFGDMKANYTVKQSVEVLTTVHGLEPREAEINTTTPKKPTSQPETEKLKKPNQSGTSNEPTNIQDIAVIGMSGRYPDATNLTQLWDNLSNGKNSIKKGPDWRSRFIDPDTPQHLGGFVDDVDKFDSLFFSISPREAQNMDPQERMMMEVSWEALEDAGYHPESLVESIGSKQVGVFVGAVWSYYEMLGVENRLSGGHSQANSQHWGISNRVSSFMNFCGPSLTVDTACSSSLTAIHLACESLRHGECKVALAGGVNLDLHPSKYHITEAAQFLSEDGLCRAFGQGGTGYVAGEGVGTLLLKPLNQAQLDGDHIYGIIKSSVTNHGGRTAGYTVPNPNAQADLISAALTKANISADTIGYIEAHGTGTELGDPIEIQGATKAYRKDTAVNQYCSIGSIKTNIGHLEAAAGVAGATKLLLQLKHQQLVPSLHSENLNEHIDFENSPFYVQQDKEFWQPLKASGKTLPRRAGLSSFGAGGTNVHIIFEEHLTQEKVNQQNHSNAPQLIVLSARKESQLQILVKQLLDWIKNKQNINLNDLAYTLQTGRLSMNKRLAILVNDKSELTEALRDYLNHQTNSNLYLSDNSTQPVMDLFDGDESKQIIDLLINNGSHHKIAKLWVNGVDINWSVNGNKSNKKIPLPTYPFARESHWIEPIKIKSSPTELKIEPSPTNTSIGQIQTHPLIDENVSGDDHFEYRKQFDLNQFVFRDHIVADLPTLPGVAYMEMALAVARQSTNQPINTLKNLIWASPINTQSSSDIRILLNQAKDSIAYEICTYDNDENKQIHSQGKVDKHIQVEPLIPSKNINDIKNRCSNYQSKTACYDLLSTRKLNYGKSLQSIEGFYCGRHEGLTVLKLPVAVVSTFDDYIAHPSILDGAVQSIISLLEFADTDTQAGVPYVPFVLSELVMHKPLTKNAFAHLKLVNATQQRNDIKKINIDILNEAGDVLLQMKDFSFKSIGSEGAIKTVKKSSSNAHKTTQFKELNQPDVVVYKPLWKPEEIVNQIDENKLLFGVGAFILFDDDRDNKKLLIKALHTDQSLVVQVDSREKFFKVDRSHYQLNPTDPEQLQKLIDSILADGLVPNRFIQNLSKSEYLSETTDFEDELNHSLYAVLVLSQVLLKNRKKIDSKFLQFTYIYHVNCNEVQPIYGTNGAFFKSIKQEGANIDVKSICIKHKSKDIQRIDWSKIIQEIHQRDELEVMYTGSQRLIRKTQTINVSEQDTSDLELAKEGGVYLITGGVGGLGLLFAQYLLKFKGTHLILTGRTHCNDDIKAKIEQLSGEVEYRNCDLSNSQQVSQVIADLTKTYGHIDGIIHAAGIIKDGFLWNKNTTQFKEVLAAKTKGTINLDQATKTLDLDYFVMCSSIASTLGNMGQSDYAAGNRFMDDFAVLRTQWTHDGMRAGHTVSINWPLWKEGGMQVNEQAEQWLYENWGMQPLATQTGLEALKFAIKSCSPVFGLVQGDAKKIQQILSIESPVFDHSNESTNTHQKTVSAEVKVNQLNTQNIQLTSNDLKIKTEQDLTEMVVSLLKIKAEDIEFADNMSTYGFDSVTFTEFANLINKELEIDVTPLIFFEQETLDELTAYLLEDFADDLNTHYLQNDLVNEPNELTENKVDLNKNRFSENQHVPDHSNSSSESYHEAENKTQQFNEMEDKKNEDIAIIGMSGIMPQSADLDVFWDNLLNEKNLVTKIPKDRWDWKKFYGESDLGNSKTKIKWGGFIPEVDKFDADFFNISPLEAELTDPQQRLFLETVWHTVEDAGYQASSLSGTNTGVFVGIGTSDYHELMREQNSDFEAYSVMGWMHAVLANRISYFFNWSGPSEPIGTACSSSLVAIDRAVQAIRSGQCDQCIAGGISLILNPGLHIGLGKAAMLSPDGQCKTFDHRANGYVRSEGVGSLLLKPLSQAQADGDHIYAVIKGSAVNHGGHVNTFTTPNPKAQTAVMSMAYDDAKIDPATLTYIEAHGTGTALGDPIEIQGLLKAFKNKANQQKTVHDHKEYCALGSVKTNVGHLELAAGMAGMFKLILSLKNQTIPASINFEKVNPYIKLENTPFRLATKTQHWDQIQDINGELVPRRAGISSFGFGGVNAHMILEEYTPVKAQNIQQIQNTEQLILLSTKYKSGINAYAQQLLQYIQSGQADNSLPELSELAAGFQQGRESMPIKMALLVTDYEELMDKLTRYCTGQSIEDVFERVENQPTKDILQTHDLANMMANHDLRGLAKMWLAGVDIDWQKINPRQQKISLPRYPFQKNRFWLLKADYTGAVYDEFKAADNNLNSLNESPHDALNDSDVVSNQEPSQKINEHRQEIIHGIQMELIKNSEHTYLLNLLIGDDCNYLNDHDIAGKTIMPAAVYLELVNQALITITDSKAVDFLDVQWLGAFVKGINNSDLKLALTENENSFNFLFYSGERSNTSQHHCQGTVSTYANEFKIEDELFDSSVMDQEIPNQAGIYQLFKSKGYNYGSCLTAINILKTGSNQCYASLSLPKQTHTFNSQSLHPSIIDGALQTMLGVLLFNDNDSTMQVPVSVSTIEWLKPLTENCFVKVVSKQPMPTTATAIQSSFEIKIFDQDKKLAVIFSDLVVKSFISTDNTTITNTHITNAESSEQLLYHTVNYLTQMIADETKRDSSTIQADSHFDAFGIDSFLAMRMTKKLEKEIGPVLKSLFFEHRTLHSLAEYLIATHERGLKLLFNQKMTTQTTEASDKPSKTAEKIDSMLGNNGAEIDKELMELTCDYLSQMVAEETKHPRANIQPESQFDAYGIDSFLAMRMTKKLEKAIGTINKTAFFEHNTIAQLAHYLINHFEAELFQLFKSDLEVPKKALGDSKQNKTEVSEIKTQNPNQLQHVVMDYLIQMIADETKRDRIQITPETEFIGLGIDSFLAMRMTKKLEKSIGTISKTAFFEYKNITEFAIYLIQNCQADLTSLFPDMDLASTDSLPEESSQEKSSQKESNLVFNTNSNYTVINEDDLPSQPHNQKIIENLNAQYGKENKALARNAIAPLIFISRSKNAYFNFNQNKEVALAFTYVGAEKDLQQIADEFVDFCSQRGVQANMLLESELKSSEDKPYSSNAFGVMQRLTDIDSMTLKGSSMRRLRYQISKFKSSGNCVFSEYTNGEDTDQDQAICEKIDEWAATKNMVNPYIWEVKDKIFQGQLPKEHRMFLTHVNEVLQNVIVITELTSENGYLMDLEFYGNQMPLGGLEYSIWHILQILKSEGCEVFSMGATFGVISQENISNNPDVFSILENLQQQGAFDGTGNLQFKNKFRPINSTLYLCRTLDADPETTVDVIMMIANPFNQESSDVAVKK